MKRSILVLIAIVLGAVGIYAWFYPLNNGTLSVSSQPTDLLVFVGATANPCSEATCTYQLRPNQYSITLRKDGYFPYFEDIEIRRGKTINISANLELIPDLIVSPIIPLEPKERAFKAAPSNISAETIVASSWNDDLNQFAYLDNSDQRLKIWQEGETKRIVQLRNLSSDLQLIWSSNDRHILGQDGNALYFIDTQKATRHKIDSTFIPQNMSWSPSGQQLITNDEQNNLYKINFENRNITAIDLNINLSQASWKDDENLIVFSIDDFENKTVIEQYNIDQNSRTPIVTKFDFPISKITTGDENQVYLYNSSDQTWYVLQQ